MVFGMKGALWTSVATFAAMLFCAGVVLAGIYPRRPNDVVGWVVLVIVSVPLLIGLELIGTALLENRLVARMNRPARIIYGVAAVAFVAVLLFFGGNWLEPHLGTW